MEAMRARQKRAGTNMDDDLTNRYSARPGVPSSASQRKAINGVLVPSRTAFVGVKTKSTRPAKPDSDDEIDSLSSQAADSDDEERTRVTRVSTKQQAQEDDLLDVNGRKMPAHPNFPPRKAPLPKFKKNKTAPSGSSTSTDVTPSSSQSRVQFPASQSGTALDLAALKGNENGKLSRSSSTSGIAGTSPSQQLSSTFNSGSPLPNIRKKLPGTYPEPSPLAKSRSVSLEVLPPEPQPTKKGKEKAKPKPAPFPLDSSPADSSRSSRQAPSPRIRPSASTSKAPRTSGSARKVNKRRIISESEPDSDDDLFGSDPEETTPRGKATRPSNRQSSPAATPIASRSTADIDLTETRQQPKARPKPRAKIKQKTATDFPALSPLSSQAGADRSSSPELASTPKKRGGTAFPLSMYSPLSSPAPEPPSREKTAPFPMSISPLKLSSVSETPNAPIWEESDHDDRIDLTSSDVVVNLCPYCDAPMPSIEERTPQLSRLLAAAERRSKPAPRPGHPHARRAPVSVHGAVCERHDFETKELPRARARGWPINIAWDALRGRIERLQPKLAKLVHGDEKARKESIFWRSVEEDVRKSGSRAVAGVKGQFESFDKVQPGYYGEKGAHIIYQTIYNLFPPSAFDVKLLGALSPDIVLQRVLVPEAALSLVMEDTDEDVATASRILVESARFGAIMYPLHDGDQDQRDIGQGMVRERARARAKVIAAEERVEEEMLREENEKRRKREELSEAGSEEGGRRARSTKRRKPTPDASVPTDGDDPPPRRVPKPRPRPVSRQMESDSDASVRSTRSTRSMRSRSSTASKPDPGADSDIIEIVNPAVQARPKPRKVHKRTGAASASDMDISSGAERVHDVDATPRPLARQRQPRGQGKGASSSRNPDWSRSQREPLDISSSDDEEPGGTSRRSSSRAGDAGIPAADSWLLSE